MDNVLNLLLEHFVIHSTTIAFPELIFPICLRVSHVENPATLSEFHLSIFKSVFFRLSSDT